MGVDSPFRQDLPHRTHNIQTDEDIIGEYASMPFHVQPVTGPSVEHGAVQTSFVGRDTTDYSVQSSPLLEIESMPYWKRKPIYMSSDAFFCKYVMHQKKSRLQSAFGRSFHRSHKCRRKAQIYVALLVCLSP